MPKEESEGDSDGLPEDEFATFAIFAAAAKKATDAELADLLMGFPSETSIQHRAIVAEQARRRDVPLPEPLTVPDVGQPQPVAVSVPVAVPLPAGVQLSSAGRRLGAYALDVLLFVVTLVIGWLVWSLIVWGRGQSPAKQLLHMRVVYLRNGAHVSWGRMAFREVIGKGAVGIVASITFIGYILYFWLLWDDKRQELWDKMADTVVVDDPSDILA